jgi:anti-anti-sigma regulatory factor
MNDHSQRHDKSANEHRRQSSRPHAEQNQEQHFIEVERLGDWVPAEELREAALACVNCGGDVTINLDHIDHLDASALQILLALDAEQGKRSRTLLFVKASSPLRDWFEFAGVADHFSMRERKPSICEGDLALGTTGFDLAFGNDTVCEDT